MATTSERLKQIMSIRNMKQVDLIERTGINKGALSSYISGRYLPKQDNIYKLAVALDVNPAWLMGLDVPMEVPEFEPLELSEEIKEAIEKFKAYSIAPPEIKAAIDSLLEASKALRIPELPALKGIKVPKPSAELPHLKPDKE